MDGVQVDEQARVTPVMARLSVLGMTTMLLVGCGTMGPDLWVSTDPTQGQQASYECDGGRQRQWLVFW